MILLFDIGNTHSHLGLSSGGKISRQVNMPTRFWFNGDAPKFLEKFLHKKKITEVAICSVVPGATFHAQQFGKQLTGQEPFILTHRTVTGVGIDYPKPDSIGSDRLANSIAVMKKFGAPALVVAFGTAVAFDVVDRKSNYIGGIIAPGLAAMTDYLHEKTALLPRIKIREPKGVVGKTTEEAMLVGAVHGYRGLIRELIKEVKTELKSPRLNVVATGGYAELISAGLAEIKSVEPNLTLEGLLIAREAWAKTAKTI